jgi:transcriptional regulator with XRE-family HTH domain
MDAVTLAEAAGAGARAVRTAAGLTLAEVAQAARLRGLDSWSSGRVGDFEAGRVSPNLATLLAVVAALSDASGKPVTLADLFQGQKPVRVNDRLVVMSHMIAAALAGQRLVIDPLWYTTPDAQVPTTDLVPRSVLLDVENAFSEGDLRIANSLGLTRDVAIIAMAKAWKRTFVAERDRLAGPDANAQAKGIISRRLKSDLCRIVDEYNLEGPPDGDD